MRTLQSIIEELIPISTALSASSVEPNVDCALRNLLKDILDKTKPLHYKNSNFSGWLEVK